MSIQNTTNIRIGFSNYLSDCTEQYTIQFVNHLSDFVGQDVFNKFFL